MVVLTKGRIVRVWFRGKWITGHFFDGAGFIELVKSSLGLISLPIKGFAAEMNCHETG